MYICIFKSSIKIKWSKIRHTGLFLCLTKQNAMKMYWRSGGIAPRLLDLGTRRRWVASFTSRPICPQEKSPWYTLYRRLGGLQSRSERGGEEKNFQPPLGIEP
jgi:hypothetical protein